MVSPATAEEIGAARTAYRAWDPCDDYTAPIAYAVISAAPTASDLAQAQAVAFLAGFITGRRAVLETLEGMKAR